jgi:ribosomal protein S18 acetylase RimI-like enzyme
MRTKRSHPYVALAGELVMIAAIPIAFIPDVPWWIVASALLAGMFTRAVGLPRAYPGNTPNTFPDDHSFVRQEGHQSGAQLNECLIHLRPATPNDVDAAAQLLHDAQHDLSTPINGLGSSGRAMAFYRELFVLPHTFWSYSISTVAEVDGQVVGLISHLPVSSLRDTYGPTFRGTLVTCGLFYLFRQQLRSRHIIDASPRILRHYEYHVIHLAVADACRGRGIGARLLREAHEDGVKRDCPFCILSVEIENKIAQRFFERYGYTEQARRTSDRLRKLTGVSGLIGMTADLQSISRIECPECKRTFFFHYKGWPPRARVSRYICPQCGYRA